MSGLDVGGFVRGCGVCKKAYGYTSTGGFTPPPATRGSG